MTEVREFEGRTLEEAIEAVKSATGHRPAEGEYKVLENKKGFLGLGGHVLIQVEIDTEAVSRAEARESSAQDDDPAAEIEQPLPVEAKPARGTEGVVAVDEPPGGVKPDQDDSGDEPRSDPKASVPKAKARTGTADEVEIAHSEADLQAVAVTVQEVLDEMINGMGLDLDVKSSVSGDQVVAVASGRDESRLTARHGELLSALQYLAQKMASRDHGGGFRISVDAAGFRDQRESELADLARRTAEAVKKAGRRAFLPPMMPAERRQIHMVLSDESGVRTESEGDGLKKRVAVIPSNND